MQNEEGEIVDLYIPRKCSFTNRLIRATDAGAVQFRVAKVDPVTGKALRGQNHYVSLSGALRSKGESDMALNKLMETLDKA